MAVLEGLIRALLFFFFKISLGHRHNTPGCNRKTLPIFLGAIAYLRPRWDVVVFIDNGLFNPAMPADGNPI